MITETLTEGRQRDWEYIFKKLKEQGIEIAELQRLISEMESDGVTTDDFVTQLDQDTNKGITEQDSAPIRFLAQAAKDAADTAQEAAEAAQGSADTAQSVAVTAQSAANDAKSAATTATNTANAAKSTAETAQGTANAAQGTANTAKSAADAATVAAGNAQNAAVAAQGVATTAKNEAEDAQEAAEDAQNTAEAATNTANAAQGVAAIAYNTANAAQETADTAQSAAATAQGTANTAKGTANAAQTAASEAQETANTALAAANNAQGVADTAIDTANTAQGIANSAQGTAVEANETANTAKGTADAAQVTAVEALELANTAQGTANAAQTAASEAQETANTAQIVSTEAQETANIASGTANAAESAATSATQTANYAKGTADNARDVAEGALAAIDAESARAEQAENDILTELTQEAARAMGVEGDLQEAVEGAQGTAEAALPKTDVVTPNESATTGQAADAAALNTILQGFVKLVSAATQEVFSNLALKTYVDTGSGQTKAFQLLGTAIDGTEHTLIELAEYGAAQQVEIGSETIHLNLNNLGPVGGDNHITCDTHDDTGAAVKLSVAWLTDVVAQCAATLTGAKTYTDNRITQMLVDALILQEPCKESELPAGPFDPSHNGYFYQITDFDVTYPGEDKKGSAVWYDNMDNYYLAVDTYNNADDDTITKNSNGEFIVADVDTGTVIEDTSGGFANNVTLGFKAFIAAVIAKINGLFSLVSGLTTAIGEKYTKPDGGIPTSDMALTQGQQDALNSGITAGLVTTFGGKQDALQSGTNIKTINDTSVLGAGNITVTASNFGGYRQDFLNVASNAQFTLTLNTAWSNNPKSGVLQIMASSEYAGGYAKVYISLNSGAANSYNAQILETWQSSTQSSDHLFEVVSATGGKLTFKVINNDSRYSNKIHVAWDSQSDWTLTKV
ncbi:MAG: hypothetical protein LBK63_06805 [Treponema sp.]|jgi:hypothetical protein|nr:hypothetical protein [Treponema sp.]